MQMGADKRYLSRHQHYLAPLFQTNISGTGQQIRGVAVGDAGKRFHAARHDHHAGGDERAAGDARRQVMIVMYIISQFIHLPDFQVGLFLKVSDRTFGNYQMGFYLRIILSSCSSL